MSKKGVTYSFAFQFLSWFCPPQLLEEIEGDLIQRFELDSLKLGAARAKRRLLWNVIRFFRPGIVLRNKSSEINRVFMFKNYFVVAWRSILKRKAFSAINVLGISFGISFALLAALFVQDELSFDKTHVNRELIYRIDNFRIVDSVRDMSYRGRSLPLPFASAIKESVSGIDYITRFDDRTGFIKTPQKQFREKIYFADADFVKMFTLEFIAGGGKSFLSDEKNILLSHEKAIKLFGKTEVLGNTVEWEGTAFTVAGVFNKLPCNSSFDFELLFRFENYPQYQKQRDDWNAWYGSVFAMRNPSTPQVEIESGLDEFSKKHFTRGNERTGLALTSLSEIHFDSQVEWVNVSNVKYSYILSGIALVVLLVACANYILLSLAGSISRAREIGIRKVIGATRQMVRAQFFRESLFIIIFSLPVSFIILQIVLPEFNYFMGREIAMTKVGSIGSLALIVILVVTGLLAGGYPAIILSNLVPEKILKSNTSGNYKTKFSGLLIVFQFTTCFILLICSLLMFKQMNMIQTSDLGFNKEQIVIVDANNDQRIDGRNILKRFRSELENETDIISLSGLKSDFGKIPMSMSFKDESGKEISTHFASVDYDFFEMLDIPLVEGRYFSRTFPADTSNRFVINESYLKQMNTKSYAGKPLPLAPGSEVVGVVKDFNFESLEFEVKPIAFMMGKSIEKIFIKITPENIPATIAKLENCWKKTVGDEAFSFTFLSDHLNKQYQRYTQWIRIMTISAFVAIGIACLGLLGIINLAVVNRTKEIGIRKVLGASVSSIMYLFSKYYIRLIFTGFLLAAPLAYFLSTRWLQNFTYKTEINWVIFIAPLMLILGLAITVMLSQIVRKAQVNPVESIRYE